MQSFLLKLGIGRRMSGFVGIAARPGSRPAIDETQLTIMRDASAARGPDGEGVLFRRNVAMGCRRHAVRDLVGGSQPWSTADDNASIVFDGEIFNDRQLRQELEALGHFFRSRSDTEVIVRAWQEWGERCLRKLRGSFAFGLYDFQQDCLLLARDHAGSRSLFVTVPLGFLVEPRLAIMSAGKCARQTYE